MKIQNLRNGMVFRKKADSGQSEHYEVADIIQDSVNGYSREVITLGNVSTKQTTSVTMQDLNNPKQWEEVKGAVVTEQTEIVKKVVFSDGKEQVLDRKAMTQEKAHIESVPNKEAKTVKKTYVINNNRFIEMAKHKEARDNKTNTMTKAFAKMEPKEKVVEVEEPVVYNKMYYVSLMSYTYDNLHGLGMAVRGNVQLFAGVHSKPRGLSTQVLKQELDAFRDGLSIREVRALGNRIKALTPEQIGTPVSVQMIIMRLIKAIYHYGTPEEKTAFDYSVAKEAS
jgi:hypothetical protein